MATPETPEATVRPFYCGTQFQDWMDGNCRGCRKAAPPDSGYSAMVCEIEQALALAAITDGTIPLPIANRMHPTREGYGWPCMERNPPFVNVRADGTVDKSIPRPEVPHA